jgi:hypothetical protein
MKAVFGRVSNIKPFPSTGNTRIEIEVPVEQHVAVTGMLFGQDVLITIAPSGMGGYGVKDADGHAEAAEEPGEKAGQLAYELTKKGYFRNPHLWDCLEKVGIYTQEQHKAYIEGLPCCAHGLKYSGPDLLGMACLGDVVLHHVRTSENSGTGIKPKHWFGVPLCHEHHRAIHSTAATREIKDAALLQAVAITQDKAKEAIKAYLGMDSLRELTKDGLRDFEEQIGMRV